MAACASIDLRDKQWTMTEPLIPKKKSTWGRCRNDDQQTLNGILQTPKTGYA